jgi:transcriptional repressor NrdR
VSEEALESLGMEIEEVLRMEGPDVTTEQIGRAVLDRVRDLDDVAYLRFVSVYKGFEDLTDFEREVVLLSRSHEKGNAEPG